MRRLIVATVLVAGCVLSGMAWFQPATESKPVETLLPANALLYVNYDGLNQHEAGWKRTAAADALVESGFVDVCLKAVRGLIRQAGDDAVKMSERVSKQLYGNGFSFSLSLNQSQGGPPLPLAQLVLREGADMHGPFGSVVREFAGSETEVAEADVSGRSVQSIVIPDTPGIQLAWWKEGTHLQVAVGLQPAQMAIAIAKGEADSIVTSPLWKEVQSTEQFEVVTSGWFDFVGLTSPFKEIPLPLPPDENGEQLTLGKVIDLVGLGNFQHVVTRSGFNGPSLWTETEIVAPGEKTGFLAGLSQETMTWDEVPSLPSSQGAFTALKMDWGKLLAEGLRLYESFEGMVPPGTAPPLDEVLSMLRDQLNFDIQADFFELFGNRVCAYMDDNQSAFFMPGIGVMLEVKDAARLRESLIKIANRINAEAPPETARISAATKQGRDFAVLDLGGGFFSLAAALDDNWLIVGLSPQIVESTLLRLDGKLPSWKPNDEWKTAFASLPQEYTSITGIDVRRTYQMLSTAAPTLIGLAQVGITQSRQYGIQMSLPVSAADFPPAELVTQGLFPMVSVSTPTERGMKWVTRTSAPGLPFASSGSGAATVPVLIALLLPAVQQAREAARRSVSKNNLKQIALAVHNYADANNHLPQGTIPNDNLKPIDRLSWMVSILPFLEQQALYHQIDQTKGWQTQAEQLEGTVIPTFQNPGMDEQLTEEERAMTHYVGIAGLGKDGPTLPVTDPKAGIFAYNRQTRFRDILDGTSNTMMVSEAIENLGYWAAGGAPTIRPLTEAPYVNGTDGLGSPFQGGMHIVLTDGAVRFVSESIDDAIMEALSTIRGGEAIGEF